MTLIEKIIQIYPELKDQIGKENGVFPSQILLMNLGDGNGDFIAKWDHPTLPRPTQAQLDAAGV